MLATGDAVPSGRRSTDAHQRAADESLTAQSHRQIVHTDRFLYVDPTGKAIDDALGTRAYSAE